MDKQQRIEDRRYIELAEALQKGDEYEFLVRFTRSLNDDIGCGGKPLASTMPLAEALLQQFRGELQDAYKKTALAGRFEIIGGPSVKLPF